MKDRETAIYILMDIIHEQGYNNIVLRKTLGRDDTLTTVQKAFVTELVNGTLRNLIYIDYVIDQFSNTKTTKMKPLIASILRTSVYQILFMDKVPVSAVCNEAVKIAKQRGFQTLTGFVNGVLRNIVRNADNIQWPDAQADRERYLSVKYSYQPWMIAYWRRQYDDETITQILEGNNETPEVTVCTNLLKTTPEALMETLVAEGVGVTRGHIHKNCLRLSRVGDLAKLRSYQEGLFHIMDESAALAVDVLHPTPGSTMIDICAAPGGKSFYAAYQMGNMGKIYARDIYEHKLQLIEDTKKRLGIEIIETQLQDGLAVQEGDKASADYVLLDAPCSGLGLLRKKPDIKYSKTYEDVLALSALQRTLLEAAQQYVAEGGVLVYSTCTISEEENLKNIQWFVERYPFEPEDITPYQPTNIASAKDGYIEILPHMYHTDGFFMARLRRKK